MHTDWATGPIDTTASDDAISDLTGGDEAARAEAATRVEQHPARYHPGVFFVLATIRLTQERHGDAMFWFYAGQLRTRFDVNRSADKLAGTVLSRYNDGFGPPINRYAFQHLDELEATVERVLEFDRSTPHHYDPRWINRHTPGAMVAALSRQPLDPTTMTRPADEWPAIAERTRAEYADGFARAMQRARDLPTTSQG